MPNRIRVALITSLTLISSLLAVGSAGAVVTPQKVVIIVGPTGAQTDDYRQKGDSYAATATAAGANVVKVYSPNATWANVKAAVDGANIVIYLGHGNGYPNPYNSGAEPTDRDNGWGLNRATTNGDDDNWGSTMVYCGEQALLGTLTSASAAQWAYCGGSTNTDGITPAPNWVMIYSNACYAPGASEGFDVPATEAVALQRVRNYSYPNLMLGAGAYFATDMGASGLIDTILRNPEMPFGAIAESANGYDISQQRHFDHPDLGGYRIWIQNSGAPTSGSYKLAYAGRQLHRLQVRRRRHCDRPEGRQPGHGLGRQHQCPGQHPQPAGLLVLRHQRHLGRLLGRRIQQRVPGFGASASVLAARATTYSPPVSLVFKAGSYTGYKFDGAGTAIGLKGGGLVTDSARQHQCPGQHPQPAGLLVLRHQRHLGRLLGRRIQQRVPGFGASASVLAARSDHLQPAGLAGLQGRQLHRLQVRRRRHCDRPEGRQPGHGLGRQHQCPGQHPQPAGLLVLRHQRHLGRLLGRRIQQRVPGFPLRPHTRVGLPAYDDAGPSVLWSGVERVGMVQNEAVSALVAALASTRRWSISVTRRILIFSALLTVFVGSLSVPTAAFGADPGHGKTPLVEIPPTRPDGPVLLPDGRVLPLKPASVKESSIQAEMLAAHAGDRLQFVPGAPPHPLGAPQTTLSLFSSTERITPLRLGPASDTTATLATAIMPNGLRKEVLGFLPYWMLDADSLQWMQYQLVSTIAYFGVAAQADGTLQTISGGSPTAGWSGWNSSAMTNVINAAHARGVRVVLTVTMMAWDGGAAQATLLGNATARAQLVNAIVSTVASRAADGVNLDFEPVSTTLRDQYTTFVRELKAGLAAAGVGSYLTVCTMAGAAIWASGYDLAGLTAAGAADAVFVMGYDFSWSGSARAGGVASMESPYVLDVGDSIDSYLSIIPGSKIIWGVPYYGRTWLTTSDALNATTVSGASGLSKAYYYTGARNLAATYGRRWDDVGKVPWFAYYDSTKASWVEGYYDDAVSLAEKYDMVNARGLAGAGMWTLLMDQGDGALWDLLAAKFVQTTTYSPPVSLVFKAGSYTGYKFDGAGTAIGLKGGSLVTDSGRQHQCPGQHPQPAGLLVLRHQRHLGRLLGRQSSSVYLASAPPPVSWPPGATTNARRSRWSSRPAATPATSSTAPALRSA